MQICYIYFRHFYIYIYDIASCEKWSPVHNDFFTTTATAAAYLEVCVFRVVLLLTNQCQDNIYFAVNTEK